MAAERDDLQQETYRLVRDNNRMLHAMRRNAFFGTVFKLLMYAAMIGVPIWFYFTYMQPVLSSAVSTLSQVQDAGAQIGAQFNGLSSMLEQVKKIPGIGNFGE